MIRNDGKKLYIQRLSEKASILVNGDELGSEQVQLHHHYRVLFGPSHLFVVTIPKEAAAAAKAGKKQKHPTWEDAQAEIAQHTGLTTEGVQDPEDLLIQVGLRSGPRMSAPPARACVAAVLVAARSNMLPASSRCEVAAHRWPVLLPRLSPERRRRSLSR